MASTAWLSIRAYAKHRAARELPGRSHTAVRRAIAAGRLSESVQHEGGKVKIDPELADQEWEGTTDPALQREAPPEKPPSEEATPGLWPGVVDDRPRREEKLEGRGREPGSKQEPHRPGEPTHLTRLTNQRSRKLEIETELQRLELERKRGDLVLRADVERDAAACARMVRERLQAISDRVSDEFAATADGHEIRRRLDEEIRVALIELAGEEPEADVA